MDKDEAVSVLRQRLNEREDLGHLYSEPVFYDAIYTFDASYDVLERLVREEVPEGSRILYVGCGTGNLIKRLERDYKIVGVDKSQEMVNYCREKTNSRILKQKATELTFENDFDAIIHLGLSFNYLKRREAQEALEKYYKAINSGGKLILDSFTNLSSAKCIKSTYKCNGLSLKTSIDFSSKGEWFEVEFKYLIEENGEKFELVDKHEMRSVSKSDLIDKLEEAGFTSVECEKLYGSDYFQKAVAKKK